MIIVDNICILCNPTPITRFIKQTEPLVDINARRAWFVLHILFQLKLS